MNISDKIANLSKNPLARPNRFRVAINPPILLRGLFPRLQDQDIEYIAEKVEIPSLGVSNIDHVLDQSLNIQVPFRRVPQGTINITFQLDENHFIRKFIESWFSFLVDGIGSNSLTYFVSEYYSNSAGTIVVQQDSTSGLPFNTTGRKFSSYPISVFQRAYPAQAQPFNYDWSERDSYLPYTVTFNYYNTFTI